MTHSVDRNMYHQLQKYPDGGHLSRLLFKDAATASAEQPF